MSNKDLRINEFAIDHKSMTQRNSLVFAENLAFRDKKRYEGVVSNSSNNTNETNMRAEKNLNLTQPRFDVSKRPYAQMLQNFKNKEVAKTAKSNFSESRNRKSNSQRSSLKHMIKAATSRFQY